MSVSNTTKRVKEIRRKTRRKFSSEEKIRIVLEGLRGEGSIAQAALVHGVLDGVPRPGVLIQMHRKHPQQQLTVQ